MGPDYFTLDILFTTVRKVRPQVVLEIGSGWSTLIIAEALRQNGFGHLYSLDEDEAWANTTRAALPAGAACTVSYVPATEFESDGGCAVRHTLPVTNPDIVFIDHHGRCICYDPVDLYEGGARPLVLVDKKASTTAYLARRLPCTLEVVRGIVDQTALVNVLRPRA